MSLINNNNIFFLFVHTHCGSTFSYNCSPSQISLSAGTKPYVDRIHEVGEKDPVLLVAHSYTRYMGDLSGGQILKKVAQRALKLPTTGEGLNFYQFEGIHSHKGFKQLYRSRMNELELDTEAKERLVDESNRAFGFNMMVSEQGGYLTDMRQNMEKKQMNKKKVFFVVGMIYISGWQLASRVPKLAAANNTWSAR